MKFGTRVIIERGGYLPEPGTPGCRRRVRGTLVGARLNLRRVRLDEDDPLDTVGWSRAGDIGWWAASMVSAAPAAREEEQK